MTRRLVVTVSCAAVAAATALSANVAHAADTAALALAPFGSDNVLLATSSTADVEEWIDGDSGWTGPTTVPGTTGLADSAPGANVFDAGSQLDVFYRLGDGGIGEAYEAATQSLWYPTLELPGTPGTAASAPSATPFDSEDYVFYEGTDGALHASIYSHKTRWSTATVAGTAGTMASAPAATTFDSGDDLEVFYENTTGGLDQVTYTSADGWTGPVTVAGTTGTLASAPAATTDGSGDNLEVFYETSAGALGKVASTSAGAWETPNTVPGTTGTVASTPAADDFPSDQLDAVYRTASGGIDQSAYTLSTGWTQSVVVAPPPVTTTPAPTPTPSPPATTTPAKTRSRVDVNVALVWTYRRHGAERARLRKAAIAHFPRNARITVSCAGPGCRHLKLTARRASLPHLWRQLERRSFRPGDRITITVTRPGRIAERGTLLVRPHAAPKFVAATTGKGRTTEKTKPKR